MLDEFSRSVDSSSDMEVTRPSMGRSRELSDRRAEMSLCGPPTGPHGTHADASILSSRQVCLPYVRMFPIYSISH